MHFTIEGLLEGNDVAEWYRAADRRWEAIMNNPDAATVEGLATILTAEQLRFEGECGGRWPGQEVMAVAGIARLYSTTDGFGDNLETARRIAEAFERSSCSMEVKSHARMVAASYNLSEEQ